MEGLQVLQYLVLDDCSSKANQLWMYLGLVHMAFQPLVANWALFTLPRPIALGKLSPPFTYPMVFTASVRLCAAAAALLLIKYIPALVALLDMQQLLTGVLAPYLPARVLSALVTNSCSAPELGCGTQLCSTVGKYHLAWYAPQMGSGYYVPSFFLHFFAMFGPSLLFGSTYHRLVMGLVFVSGPLVSEFIMWGGSQDVRVHEWQSVWCLFSAAQVLGALGIEVVANGILNKRWVLPKKVALEPQTDGLSPTTWCASSLHKAVVVIH
ncbi:hypothetical protein OEZ85_012052 [Tetradesmus obliquus]|uniref:Alpha-1,3-glucosyltransferase n=1 Tax=Tetradesmus obliquus TaxID=3088 RepID=A0ABY8TSA7_TETOB|nr:hypothetical protein OEZ85_012052 [Tetradesmus obliquus]